VALLAPLVASGLALSGCMSSPTYGTDKTANEQLVGDLSNAFSLMPPKKEKIDYKPRPALVKPAPGEKESLPAPQDSITQTASNQWPESPEQRRARLRDEATKHINDTNFQAQIVDDDPNAVPVADNGSKNGVPQLGHDRAPAWTPEDSSAGTAKRRAEIQKRLQEQNQGDPTNRKYLSEPPLAYRAPAATAPQNDIGEDEYKKERRLKREAAAKGGKKSWSDWLPW
jgi:hypothetical protein